MGSSIQLSSPPVPSLLPSFTFEEHFMKQSLPFADTLKLYSAAEYFESSYAKQPPKEEHRQTLKDYVAGALINTIDHLGFVASKVSELIDKEVNILSETEHRISSTEQRLRTGRALLDRAALHMTPSTPRHHKRYILPGGDFASADSSRAVPYRVETMTRERSIQPFAERTLSPSTRIRTSSFRKVIASSSFRRGHSSPLKSRCPPPPSSSPGTFLFSESPASSSVPSHSPDLSLRSVSFSSRRSLLGASSSWLRGLGGPRKAVGLSFHCVEGEWDGVEQSPNRSKRMLETVTGWRLSGKGNVFP